MSRRGAELRAWSVGASELLWRADPQVWDAVAPLLFPVVGWCRDGQARVDGRAYPMPVHGFAASSEFALEERGENFVRFSLAESARTLAHYPFRFRLEAEYRLSPRDLSVRLRVANTGDRVMPYACGLHPGFAWPFCGGEQGDYAAVFAQAEEPSVPQIAPGGLFCARRRPVPLDGRRLPLSPELFAQEALCFLDARSGSVALEGPGGGRIEVAADGFAHWALWSRPGAPFVCVESWTGHGDPEHFGGDLRDKPGMILLGPGETRTHGAELRYGAPGP
ncbi:MAG: Galactose mutarotase [Hyphomicrobiales bacterium]|nr:Galactose mutarotase [Hyphomicrobiales bacterium]